MSTTIRKYYPAYVTDFSEEKFTVKSTEEALALEFIAKHKSEPSFHRFSISPSDSVYATEDALMLELKGGKVWWIIAKVSGDKLNLPEWKPVE